jgi:hypothetical protein
VRCKKVPGKRSFKSVIMVTDGQGNVTQTASNAEGFNRDCVDADDGMPRVALVAGSNRLDDCNQVTEVIEEDSGTDFTDPDTLFAQGNVEPCDGGVVTTMITAQADAAWALAVQGIPAGLPQAQSVGAESELADIVPMSGNNAQDQATIDAKEEQILNLFSPEPPEVENQGTANVNAEQGGHAATAGSAPASRDPSATRTRLRRLEANAMDLEFKLRSDTKG